jgi:hypothetical protein
MRSFLFVPLVATSIACSHQVYSPPARTIALDTARNLTPGATSLQVAASAGGAVFGPSLIAADVAVRHGLSEEVEGVFDLSAARVTDETSARTDPSFYGARAGVKINPPGTGVAVTGGVGGGVAPAGGPYVSGDAGLILSIENCYLVPYAAGGGFVSEPLEPRPIQTQAGSEPRMDTPETTYGATLGLGLRLVANPGACKGGRPAPGVILGGQYTLLWDSTSEEELFSLSLGLDFPL